MNRLSQAIVMLLFGGALIKATVTDVFLRYVKAGLRPFLLTAGILLVAAAIMTIWYELRPAPAGQEHDHGHEPDDGHGHGHGHHEPRIGWLLILPVIGLLLITPPALGAYSAGQAGTVALTGDSDYPPLPAGDPAELGLIDYASRAIFDGGKSLTGHTVQMSGFVTPGPDKKPMLARIVLTCCAADGRPIKIGLDGDVTVDAPANSWVQVDGVYSTQVGTDPVNQAKVAYLTVKSWQQISEPANPYS
ncbi:TIGR03943 family protein [Actinoplanes sp. KI2]|uniref:TIGR03943 family putative permease subunit n=1 Tax=Actinoplanes sp. KI2 TaxID=2983315 RepID=UPI0021D5D23E|nr:TIGR03943 family protein [Actinoplanes sp. KI2]MCU7724017.1 TIGR03943 family protein [Actinoplanes sp. KI2]